MDISRPFQIVTPTLDGDVLRVLAQSQVSHTGRAVHRLAGRGSEEGVRRVLRRLVREGIVREEAAGRSYLYSLNRSHLGAEAIIAVAMTRQRLIDRMTDRISTWDVKPEYAVLFGSTARNTSTGSSDIDILVVRPPLENGTAAAVDQVLLDFQLAVTSWTGNDCRILDFSVDDLDFSDDVIRNAATEGIGLWGDLFALRRRALAAHTARRTSARRRRR